MNNVVFESKEHKNFFLNALHKVGNTDSYHQAFFYIMGISPDTRANINTMFDFENDEIRPDGLKRGWQTGGSRRLCRLAMNLWSGYTEQGKENMFCPYELFDCSYQAYMMEGIKLRYPEYCRELKQSTKEKHNRTMEIGG
jgi:hypothetical protein